MGSPVSPQGHPSVPRMLREYLSSLGLLQSSLELFRGILGQIWGLWRCSCCLRKVDEYGGVRGQHQHRQMQSLCVPDALAHTSLTCRDTCIGGCSTQLAKDTHTNTSVVQIITVAEGLLTRRGCTVHLGQLELEQYLQLQK